MKKRQTVAILGASRKPDRYAYQALLLLKEKHHNIIPVNPALNFIEDIPVVHSLAEIKQNVDTLTLYVGPKRSEPVTDQIVNLNPGRVIFNPGTESEKLQSKLKDAGIKYMEACTLVLLKTGMF